MPKKSKSKDTKDVYINYEINANPNHEAKMNNKPFDVDKDIEEFRRIEPKDVFVNYKPIKQTKNKRINKKDGARSGAESKKITRIGKGKPLNKKVSTKYNY